MGGVLPDDVHLVADRPVVHEDPVLHEIPALALDPFVVVAHGAERAGLDFVGEQRHELRLDGGHVTFSIGRGAFQRTLPALAGWIADHSDELDAQEED